MTKIFAFLVGQSCRSALISWAAQRRRPTEDVKFFVLHPPRFSSLNYSIKVMYFMNYAPQLAHFQGVLSHFAEDQLKCLSMNHLYQKLTFFNRAWSSLIKIFS